MPAVGEKEGEPMLRAPARRIECGDRRRRAARRRHAIELAPPFRREENDVVAVPGASGSKRGVGTASAARRRTRQSSSACPAPGRRRSESRATRTGTWRPRSQPGSVPHPHPASAPRAGGDPLAFRLATNARRRPSGDKAKRPAGPRFAEPRSAGICAPSGSMIEERKTRVSTTGRSKKPTRARASAAMIAATDRSCSDPAQPDARPGARTVRDGGRGRFR